MTNRATVSIRAALEADAETLAELAGQLGYPAGAATLRARLAAVRNADAGEVFVAVGENATVVGWTHVAPRLGLEDAPFAEIAGLIVAEAARGLGVGAALLHTAENWARQRGYAKLRVRSNVVRERAHRFYLREGCIERKRQVVFDKALR